jgi:hypothetical protein
MVSSPVGDANALASDWRATERRSARRESGGMDPNLMEENFWC